MALGYLGLGSNVGDRLGNLREARRHLPEHGVKVLASSSVYQSAPQGEVTNQPDFLNACLEIESTLEPESLLDACKMIERDLGRGPGGQRHGPRPIDIDILMFGDAQYTSNRLEIPHVLMSARRFVLEPLIELNAGLGDIGGRPLAEALAGLVEQPVTRLGPL